MAGAQFRPPRARRRVLTDPVFSKRAPFQWMGPRASTRRCRSMVPKLDAVVISHDHYDHLDMFNAAL